MKPETFAWTPEIERRLAELWSQEPQLSAAAIGRAMGISKNAIVGKAHRLGLPGRESPIRHGQGATPKPHHRRALAVQLAAPKLAKADVVALPLPRPARTKPASQPAPIRRIRPLVKPLGVSPFKTCQWLSGDGPFTDADKCGRRTIEGRSYCGEHCARAYQQPQVAKADAA